MMKISVGYVAKVSHADHAPAWTGFFNKLPTIGVIRDAIELEEKTYPAGARAASEVRELCAIVSLASIDPAKLIEDTSIPLMISDTCLGYLDLSGVAAFKVDGRGCKPKVTGVQKSKAGRPKGKKNSPAATPAELAAA